jgi:TPR repeat protein
MTHATRQEIDALRARAEAGVASAPFSLAFMYSAGQGVRQCEGRDVTSVIFGMSP